MHDYGFWCISAFLRVFIPFSNRFPQHVISTVVSFAHAINYCLLYSSVTDVTALSGIATDVEVSIHEIETLLDEEDKQEKEFQVICYHSYLCICLY